jgi:hypothetical protein
MTMLHTTKKFLIIFSIFTLFSGFAQDRNVSVGPIPNINVEINHTRVNTPNNPASIAYDFENISKSTLSMPIPAGTPFTTLNIFIPPDGSFASSMTKGGDGNFYLITRDQNTFESALYLFNTTTGSVTLLGPINGMAGDLPNGITYNPANSTYYLISALSLYSFNLGTRLATLIGNMGIQNGAFIDLCFNEAGACYAYDVYTSSAYILNPATGAATLLGPLGYLANFGQGMSYDMETGTIYLSAFNYDTGTGQLRTMDPGTGATTLVTDWGYQQIAAFALNTQYGVPCSVGVPSNPNPPNGATNLPITGSIASWTNGSGTTNNEIWFGSVGNVAKVYDGPAITSFALPTLSYDTKYTWWVVCKNATCKTQGLPWTFTTQLDPNLVVAFNEPFNNLNCWTPIGPLGQANWSIYQSNNAGGSPPSELMLYFDPSFNGLAQIMSCPINSSTLYENTITWRQYAEYYLGTGPLIGVAVTYDGGATSTNLWETQITGNIFAEEKTVSFSTASNIYQLIFYLNGNIFNINLWDIDDIQVDYIVPVELVSFTANVTEGFVELSWITSTETNNRGFEIERASSSTMPSQGDWETVGFVPGFGTTTEIQTYSYSDRTVTSGKFSYRLKQIDFDGTYKYSNVVEVDVPLLNEFTLEQNYPNPFNPGTKIKFRLAVDSKVSLKVFDVLGQEVAALVNENLVGGVHTIDFDASSLNSGVYLYRIEATGINGTNFLDIKKMLFLK